MPTAIRIENLSKLYRLGEVGTGTISHDLNRWWARCRGKEDPYTLVGQENRRDQAASSDYAWALRDVNLEVEQGEVLGIIGANGAGKSTLLKLISRITSPTSGYIRAKGRIASLLEVGTGMHPEMTARENIYLNGAILGMKRHEITRKFDEIVDFAGCRMYVDTPVKRYSSGMRVRLGFAVAAFLEPEILIVDEVLAVGDAEFQKRAVGKMKSVSMDDGRTILFVSHSMAAVQNLCTRCILMQNGTSTYSGGVDGTVDAYIDSLRTQVDTQAAVHDRLNRGFLLFAPDHPNRDIRTVCGKGTVIKLRIQSPDPVSDPAVGIVLKDKYEQPIVGMSSRFQKVFGGSSSSSWNVNCDISTLPLNAGSYSASVWFGTKTQDLATFDSALRIHVEPGDAMQSGAMVPRGWGHFYWSPKWGIDASFAD